ncbi:MAG: hypothetical protein ABSF12_26415 [Bryobacteraceae bacterium]
MRLPRVRRFAKRAGIAIAALCIVLAVAVPVFMARCSRVQRPPKIQSEASRQRMKLTADIKDYARAEDSTYLGFPEWFIVWSYTEKADFQQAHLPSGFPFLKSIRQYWSGYCCVYGLTRGKYPFDFGEHQMLVVIGSSFSVEYLIRASYENTLGRFTEWLSSGQPVEEDVYSNRVAREYADFVHIRPFYEFSFWKRFKGLWSDDPLWGRHPLRKLERRTFLSIDYSIESLYCWLIEKATHLSYGIESADTYAWIENASERIFAENPRIHKVKEVGPGAYIVIIPRYQEFTTIAEWLADRDVHFVEIAGNDEILVSAIAPRNWTYNLTAGEEAFSSELATAPESKRVAISTPVGSLHKVVNELRNRGIRVEHVYDY